MSSPVLAAAGVYAGYGGVDIVFDVSLVVGTGEIVTIIGPNGCGKSTLLKAIVGQISLSAGGVVFDGADVSRWPAERRAAMGIGYVPQLRGVFGPLTTVENLRLGGWSLPGREVEARCAELLDTFPVLRPLARRSAGLLSGGERQTLALACALMTRPKLLVLDEPSAGLSPAAAERMFDMIARLRGAACSVLIVEQNARLSLAVSDRGYVLAGGRNYLDGTPDVISTHALGAAYLGT